MVKLGSEVSSTYQHTDKELSLLDSWTELLGVLGGAIGREANVRAGESD